jgi:hypothetical protein
MCPTDSPIPMLNRYNHCHFRTCLQMYCVPSLHCLRTAQIRTIAVHTVQRDGGTRRLFVHGMTLAVPCLDCAVLSLLYVVCVDCAASQCGRQPSLAVHWEHCSPLLSAVLDALIVPTAQYYMRSVTLKLGCMHTRLCQTLVVYHTSQTLRACGCE